MHLVEYTLNPSSMIEIALELYKVIVQVLY